MNEKIGAVSVYGLSFSALELLLVLIFRIAGIFSFAEATRLATFFLVLCAICIAGILYSVSGGDHVD